jgi:hypothetical protein
MTFDSLMLMGTVEKYWYTKAKWLKTTSSSRIEIALPVEAVPAPPISKPRKHICINGGIHSSKHVYCVGGLLYIELLMVQLTPGILYKRMPSSAAGCNIVRRRYAYYGIA